MQKSVEFLRLQQMKRPRCAKCNAHMWLIRIEPDEPCYDRRTFECPQCDHQTIEMVKYR